MKFTKPDSETVKRMTPRTIQALIDTLESQRADLVKPYDDQIKFYKDLKAKKEGEANAKATSTV